MRKKLYCLLISMFLLVGCAPKEGIVIRDAWMRTAERGGNGAVYIVIHNYSAMNDALVGASAEIAQAVEIHESQIVDDIMQMRMLSSVELASGEDVKFEPGGLHIMLVNLNEEPQVGESVEISLHFQNNADISLSVPVQLGEGHNEYDN